MAAKKTAMQKYIDNALAEAVKNGGTSICNSVIEQNIDVGDSIQSLCEAVSANARAIEAAANALSNQKVIAINIEGKQ